MRIQARRLTTLERRWTGFDCRSCRNRPTRLFLVNDDPEPAPDCDRCGRHVVHLIRRYILVPGDDRHGQDG